jgi:hypothetical protein
MVKCNIHKVTMLKTGRRDYVCPTCNRVTMQELKIMLKGGK